METFQNPIQIVKKSKRYAFKNSKGELITPFKYNKVEEFSDGLALVAILSKRNRYLVMLDRLRNNFVQDKYGFINTKGEEVIPLKYSYAESFNEGLAVVKLNSKFGFINTKEEVVVPIKYNSTFGFKEGLAVVELNQKYGFFNTKGEEVIPIQYDFAESFSEDLAAVEKDGKFGFINKEGKTVIPFKFDIANPFGYVHKGMANVVVDEKDWYINKAGEKVRDGDM